MASCLALSVSSRLSTDGPLSAVADLWLATALCAGGVAATKDGLDGPLEQLVALSGPAYAAFESLGTQFQHTASIVRASAKPAVARVRANVFAVLVKHLGLQREFSVAVESSSSGGVGEGAAAKPTTSSVVVTTALARLKGPYLSASQSAGQVPLLGEQEQSWRIFIRDVVEAVGSIEDASQRVDAAKKQLLTKVTALTEVALERLCHLRGVKFRKTDMSGCVAEIVDTIDSKFDAAAVLSIDPAECCNAVAEKVCARAAALLALEPCTGKATGGNEVKLSRTASKLRKSGLPHTDSLTRMASHVTPAPLNRSGSSLDYGAAPLEGSSSFRDEFLSTPQQQLALRRVVSAGSVGSLDVEPAGPTVLSSLAAAGLCVSSSDLAGGDNALPHVRFEDVSKLVLEFCWGTAELTKESIVERASKRQAAAESRQAALHLMHSLLQSDFRLRDDSVLVNLVASFASGSERHILDGVRGAGVTSLLSLVQCQADVWSVVVSLLADASSSEALRAACVAFVSRELLPCDAIVLLKSGLVPALARLVVLPDCTSATTALFWSTCWSVAAWTEYIENPANPDTTFPVWANVKALIGDVMQAVGTVLAHNARLAAAAATTREAAAKRPTDAQRGSDGGVSESKVAHVEELESKDDSAPTPVPVNAAAAVARDAHLHDSLPQLACIEQGILLLLSLRKSAVGAAVLRTQSILAVALELLFARDYFPLFLQRAIVRLLRDALVGTPTATTAAALTSSTECTSVEALLKYVLEHIGGTFGSALPPGAETAAKSGSGDLDVTIDDAVAVFRRMAGRASSAAKGGEAADTEVATDGVLAATTAPAIAAPASSAQKEPSYGDAAWSVLICKPSKHIDPREFKESVQDAVMACISPAIHESERVSYQSRGWENSSEMDDYLVSGLEKYVRLFSVYLSVA